MSGKLFELSEGECIASVRFLAERWGWGKDKAAKFILELEIRQEIRRETRQGESVLILCKYMDWKLETMKRQDSKPDRDKDTDQTGTRTKYNKIKKEEREKNALARPPITEIPECWSDTLPTGSARDFDKLFAKISTIHPLWVKRPHPTQIDREAMFANAKALFAITAEDWASLRDYYAVTEFPPEWQTPEAGGVLWRPDGRSRFIQAIGDILTHHDRWIHFKSKSKS